MTDEKSITRNPRELFKEIDAMCEEINAVVSDVENKIEEISPIQRVLNEQEEKKRTKRKNQYTQLLSSFLIDIEIQPFESPRDKASLHIRSVAGCFQEVVDIPESFALIEFLQEHNFVILTSGKVRRDKDPRENEDRVLTWFILQKNNAHQALKRMPENCLAFYMASSSIGTVLFIRSALKIEFCMATQHRE